MEADIPKQWLSALIDTIITVVTSWIRSPLFQLTMADPVKVMLVTLVQNIFGNKIYFYPNYNSRTFATTFLRSLVHFHCKSQEIR